MTYQPRQNDALKSTPKLWHKLNISTQKLALLLCVMAFISGMGYVLTSNATANQGFAIKSLEKQVAQLKTSNEALNLKAADLRTLSMVQASSTGLDLQPADKFEYLPSTSGAVAVR